MVSGVNIGDYTPVSPGIAENDAPHWDDPSDRTADTSVMRSAVLVLLLTLPATAQERYVERAGTKRLIPKVMNPERAGTDKTARRTEPGIGPRNAIGYVNDATFGMDYSLCGRLCRLFPGLYPDGRKPTSFSQKYQTDPPFPVKDLVALQPFRRAVKEAKAERHEEKEK